VQREIESYVRGLGLDAYLVGGAVRDELLGLDSKDADFLVPGLGIEELRGRLREHGRVEDLVVAERLVGLRLHPRDAAVRALAPAGIEFAPPRREVSTGPGRHDFVIEADPALSVEDDMRRRDFTVNAIARRLEDGALVDPVGGGADLERRVLRTVSPRSFREDPLRLVRGLRFVSQLDLDPAEETLEQMRDEAAAVSLVSGERLGDELAKLLLGTHPRKALRIARDTGVLVALLPEFRPALGFETGSERQFLPVDEHTFLVVQNAADTGAPLAVRLAALVHDLGKPLENGGEPHAAIGARIANDVLARLRYPTRLRERVRAIVRGHSFPLDEVDSARARRFLREHGDRLALDLAAFKIADLGAKRVPEEEREAARRFGELLADERSSPHSVGDLAVDGDDLLGLGFSEGPALGAALERLLDDVVADPAANTRERLLERARELR
jgi:tRNA nucleotidyltransferase (CCA-adding enzyme)